MIARNNLYSLGARALLISSLLLFGLTRNNLCWPHLLTAPVHIPPIHRQVLGRRAGELPRLPPPATPRPDGPRSPRQRMAHGILRLAQGRRRRFPRRVRIYQCATHHHARAGGYIHIYIYTPSTTYSKDVYRPTRTGTREGRMVPAANSDLLTRHPPPRPCRWLHTIYMYTASAIYSKDVYRPTRTGAREGRMVPAANSDLSTRHPPPRPCRWLHTIHILYIQHLIYILRMCIGVLRLAQGRGGGIAWRVRIY